MTLLDQPAGQGQRRPTLQVVPAVQVDALPRLQALVTDQGTTLGDFYLSYPLCCPSRSTILRGQYVHSHQIYSNLPPVGGYEKWLPLGLESSTVGTWLAPGTYWFALKSYDKQPNQSDLSNVVKVEVK